MDDKYELDDCEKGVCNHRSCQLWREGKKEEAADWSLHDEAGLAYSGLDDEGNEEWIGTHAQWQKYEELKVAADNN